MSREKDKIEKDKLVKAWEERATNLFNGAVIKRVRWMNDEECKEYDFMGKAPIIVFYNGLEIVASKDDEGNDAGSLFTNYKGLSVLPRI